MAIFVAVLGGIWFLVALLALLGMRGQADK